MSWLLIVCITSVGSYCSSYSGLSQIMTTELQCKAALTGASKNGLLAVCISPDGERIISK